MRYYFYKGPVNLKERYPELVSNSTYYYPVEEVTHYVLYQGQREQVVEYRGQAWYSVNGNEEVDTFVQRERPQVFTTTVISDQQWKPTLKVGGNEWLSIMVDKGKIIGSYDGHVYKDSLGRKFSSESFISISPEHQGRGLCREFALFTYERLLSVFNLEYITLVVASMIGAGACRCYVRAAKDIGLYTYGRTSYGGHQGERDEYLYIEVQDCASGDLDFLIFTFAPGVDETMIQTFDLEVEDDTY
nr:hypothetical protein Cbor_148 [Cedratvirus borely]